MQPYPGPPQQSPYPPGPPAQKPKSGIPVWLIVVIAVVAFVVLLVIVLAVLAVAGMRRYIDSAKTAEAKNTIGAISRAAVAAYDRDEASSALLGEPGSGHRLCATATPVPSSLSMVRGTKYTPNSSPGRDWDTGTAAAGWKCLRFTVDNPMYYRYQYIQGSGYLVPSIAPGPTGFEVSAQGDLNGDGAPSTFAITGKPGPGDTIIVNSSIYENNPFE